MRTLWRPAVALGVALALAGGCSDDSNPEPGQQVFTGGSAGVSAGGTAGSGGAGTAGASGSSGQGGAAGSTGGTDAGGAAGTTGGAAGTAGGSAGTGGAAGTTGGAAGTTGGTAGAGGEQNCDGPNGCYACKPTTLPQFLNHCSDSTCVPFDNAARLPLYNNGNLPPLP